VRRGVVVLTKIDVAGADLVGLALAEMAEAVAGSPLDRAEVVAVDATDASGLQELRWALDRLVMSAPPPVDRGRPRLWVDRSFAIRGAGTVVTGTLTDGRGRGRDAGTRAGRSVARPDRARPRRARGGRSGRARGGAAADGEASRAIDAAAGRLLDLSPGRIRHPQLRITTAS
jgi:selenocysteine-specific elongation factor